MCFSPYKGRVRDKESKRIDDTCTGCPVILLVFNSSIKLLLFVHDLLMLHTLIYVCM